MSETIQKNYLKKKIKPSLIMFWVMVGFFIGNLAGTAIYSEDGEGYIQITFIYSSEKSTWIGETQSEFEAYWNAKCADDPSLKSVKLNFQPYGSGSSLIALLNGEIKPVIWSPASSIWVPLLNSKWKDLTNTDGDIVKNTSVSTIVYSPVVIATWEDFNATHDIKGIHDLHDLIVAHPGVVKMAHTDPRSSNSGFMAMIMMTGAYLGGSNTENITMDDITDDDLIQWMTEVESSAIQYGESTGFLGRTMRDNGPESLNIAFLYENVIQDYCTVAEENFGQKMVAIYPEEGSLYSDHPFCVLDAEWVSDEQRMVANEYIEFISSKEMVTKAISTGFRPINSTLLADPVVNEVYLAAFNENYGVTSDQGLINELVPPADGSIIARIPDLWLMTRNEE